MGGARKEDVLVQNTAWGQEQNIETQRNRADTVTADYETNDHSMMESNG